MVFFRMYVITFLSSLSCSKVYFRHFMHQKCNLIGTLETFFTLNLYNFQKNLTTFGLIIEL